MRRARVASKSPQEQKRALASAHSHRSTPAGASETPPRQTRRGLRRPAREGDGLPRTGRGPDPRRPPPGRVSGPPAPVPWRSRRGPPGQPPPRMRRARVASKIPQEQKRTVASAHSQRSRPAGASETPPRRMRRGLRRRRANATVSRERAEGRVRGDGRPGSVSGPPAPVRWRSRRGPPGQPPPRMQRARVASKIPQEQKRALASAHSQRLTPAGASETPPRRTRRGLRRPARECDGLPRTGRGLGPRRRPPRSVSGPPASVRWGSRRGPPGQPPVRMRRARVVLKIPQEQKRAIASAHSSGFRRPVRTKSSICRAKPKESIP